MHTMCFGEQRAHNLPEQLALLPCETQWTTFSGSVDFLQENELALRPSIVSMSSKYGCGKGGTATSLSAFWESLKWSGPILSKVTEYVLWLERDTATVADHNSPPLAIFLGF